MDAGVPIVASGVAALHGYAEDGITALLVPPGDVDALRSAVVRLLKDRELAERLCRAASARARDWTYADYFGAIRMLIEEAAASRVPR